MYYVKNTYFGFEPKNPVTYVMTDITTGMLREDILGEFVLSAIVEGDVPIKKLETVLAALKKVFKDQLARLGYTPYLYGKTNFGLAKPAFAGERR